MDIRVDNRTMVVFDLDDTLYNEIDFLKSAYTGIARELDPDGWKQLYVYMFSLYRSGQDVFEMIAERYAVEKTELIEIYRSHIPIISPFEGVMDVCAKIRSGKGYLGILTDGRKITQMNKIKSLGLTDIIDHVVISEELGTEKPHVDNFKRFEDLYDLDTYYYIGDNLKKDFITPNERGWHTIGIMDNGQNIHFDSYRYLDSKHSPKQFVTNFRELKVIA